MMRWIIASLLLAMATSLSVAAGEENALPPEQAFRSSVRLAQPDLIEVRYQIAPGYYLYRDKFQFTSETPAVALGAPALPPGKIHEDEFFGRVETYRGDIAIRIPLTADAAQAEVRLRTLYQGCADVGICYTPQTKISVVSLTGAESIASNPSSGLLAKLSKLAEGDEADAQEEFLPVERAFEVSLRVKDAHTLVADLRPAPGYYLYRDKTEIVIAPGTQVSVSKLSLPRGEKKDDPNFGITEVFHRPFQAVANLNRAHDGAHTITADLRYQGCADKGLCYPPSVRQVRLTLPPTSPVADPAAVNPLPAAPTPVESTAPPVTPAAAPTSAAVQDETAQVTQLMTSSGFWATLASFFGFGLLLAFTPCVFPMIPILSGIIVGQGAQASKGRSVLLTVLYVLGMAITYAIAGVAAGMSGSMLSAALQNPWVLGSFAALLVLLALAMFGFYELQMPAALQTKLTLLSNRQRGGTAWGVMAMGAISALIVGPCVAAPLAGALVYISQSRDVVLGGSALFVMALGMGAPLLLVGLSAGSLLPRAGAWMQTVKNVFGVLLLAVAVWLVSPVIPVVAQLLLWGILLIVSAVFLHAVDPLPPHATGIRKLWKGVGVIALLIGVAMLIGALSGARDPLQPLAGIRTAGGAPSSPPHTPFRRVHNLQELEEAVKSSQGRPVMLDFYADWCVSCKEMERFTFSDARVQAKMQQFTLLQADVTQNSAADSQLLRQFGLFGPPGIIFFDAHGRKLDYRVVGYQGPDKFLRSLAQAAP